MKSLLLREPLLSPRTDGLLDAASPLILPIMAPRLQGDFDPSGKLKLAVWGSGELATIRFAALEGPFVYGPNRIASRQGGVFVAQSAPSLVIRGTQLKAARAARKCAWWHNPPGFEPRNAIDGNARELTVPWGTVVLERRGDDLIVCAGATPPEARSGLSLSVEAIVREADAHMAECDRLPAADPLLRSMVMQGFHAAFASVRRDEQGRFAGLAAGQAYSAPARTYYRDGYWTLQALLPHMPEMVCDEIRLLAASVRPDGEAPSGVIVSGAAQSEAWDAFRRTAPRYRDEHRRRGEWWSDHFDSPLFFILMLQDYVRQTGDHALVHEQWPVVRAIFQRYRRFDESGTGLPLKPRNDRDWADNVYRAGFVAYDCGLWVGALDAIVELGRGHDTESALLARDLAALARCSLDDALWREDRGWYADFRTTDGFVEDHLMIDSLALLRFDATSETRARSVLAAVQRLLESRNNSRQPYGDWGVLCAFPPYQRPSDTRAKSAFPFRYHNGGDWPYWDAVYAQELLRHKLPGWRYPLLRWWQTCLAQGWAGAVEYFSPPFGRGSLLQGWSALPAAVALHYCDTVISGDEDDVGGQAVDCSAGSKRRRKTR